MKSCLEMAAFSLALLLGFWDLGKFATVSHGPALAAL